MKIPDYTIYNDFYSMLITLRLYSPSQCVPVTTSSCTDALPHPYYIPVAGGEENEMFAIVTEISDPFCSNALVIYACLFIHPPCDPDRGIYIYTHWIYAHVYILMAVCMPYSRGYILSLSKYSQERWILSLIVDILATICPSPKLS